MDVLYTIIGKEEKKIRRDSIGIGNAIFGKVFGAVKQAS